MDGAFSCCFALRRPVCLHVSRLIPHAVFTARLVPCDASACSSHAQHGKQDAHRRGEHDGGEVEAAEARAARGGAGDGGAGSGAQSEEAAEVVEDGFHLQRHRGVPPCRCFDCLRKPRLPGDPGLRLRGGMRCPHSAERGFPEPSLVRRCLRRCRSHARLRCACGRLPVPALLRSEPASQGLGG